MGQHRPHHHRHHRHQPSDGLEEDHEPELDGSVGNLDKPFRPVPLSRASAHAMKHAGQMSGQQSYRDREKRNRGKIWWSNGIFFISMHVFAVVGMFCLSPATRLDYRTAILCVISWQLASFGVTIGYHRLYSHRAFTATMPLRILLAWMGSMGFQGSIKWWVLRHRLHHRFTDSPTHDPYSATNGLLWAHCGWIFRKPVYPRMKLIDRGDLEADPVVRWQHRYYIPIALFSGLILPALIGWWGWNDGLGGLVWGGAVARLLIWHTTFCINSLAHWTGLQPYTEEVTARGNYLLALLTSGEGNHNFHHAFPKDYRNGPHPADWDPTKWIILGLHRWTRLVPTVAITPEGEVRSARARVHRAEADRLEGVAGSGDDVREGTQAGEAQRVKRQEELPVWSRAEVRKRHGEWVATGEGQEGESHGKKRRRVLLLLEKCVVDVGAYLEDHPGGRDLLLAHCVAPLPATLNLQSSSGQNPSSSSPVSPPRPHTLRRRHTASSDSPASNVSSDRSSGSSVSTELTSDQEEEPSSLSRAPPGGQADPQADDVLGAGTGAAGAGGNAGARTIELRDATKAFFGGLNNHSGAAREKMRRLRVARLGD